MENLENGKQESWTLTDSPPIEHRDDEPGTHRQIENHDSASREPRPRKPLAFHMSLLALLIMGFICALDATVLGVAIPISCLFRAAFCSYTYVRQVYSTRTRRNDS